MQTFVVIQVGMCRHAIFGVYSTVGAATDAACRAAREGRDSYHRYEVRPFVLDEYVDGEDAEAPSLFGVDKGSVDAVSQ